MILIVEKKEQITIIDFELKNTRRLNKQNNFRVTRLINNDYLRNDISNKLTFKINETN
jgi:hypothetical protein